jgi:hypothetical protein
MADSSISMHIERSPRGHFGYPVVLSIVPFLILLLTIFSLVAVGVHHPDPDYIYLMNALSAAVFRAPNHTDHPGTSLQILGAVIIDVLWILRLPFIGMGKVQQDVITHPETYLWTINLMVTALIAGAMFIFGRKVHAATNSMQAAIVGQASMFLSFPAIQALPSVTPEALMLGVTLLLAAALVPASFDRPQINDRKLAVKTGGLLGLTLATKVTAAPLVTAVFLLRYRRLVLISLVSFAVTLALVMVPVRERIIDTLHWYVALATHRGIYGEGGAGFPLPSVFLQSGVYLAQTAPDLLASGCIAAIFATLLRHRRHAVNVQWCYPLFILAGIIGIQFMLVMKHPGARYLVPAVAFACLSNAMISCVAGRLIGYQRIIATVGLVIVFTFALVNNGRMSSVWLQEQHESGVQHRMLLDRLARSGCKLIPFNASTEQFAVSFGNHFANSRHSKFLAQTYPDYIEYDFGSRLFLSFSAILDRANLNAHLANEKCVFLVGTPIEKLKDEVGIRNEDLSVVEQIENSAGGVSFGAYQLHRKADGHYF